MDSLNSPEEASRTSVADPPNDKTEVLFLALGGVWLDEIHANGEITHKDVVGGSVAFTTFGARCFASETARKIRLVFIAGKDFPYEILDVFRSWDVDLSVHWRSDQPSARGALEYGGPDGSDRTYQRLTAPLSTTWEHLNLTDILNTRCFHFFETPAVLSEQVKAILGIRSRHQKKERPIIIWEPQPKSMSPETLDQHIEAAKLVDVFSPNREELAKLFTTERSHEWSREDVEKQAWRFINSGIGTGGEGGIVVRAAEAGCLLLSRLIGYAGRGTWVPAYHKDQTKVVDPTGAGNAFLGAFAVSYVEQGHLSLAAMRATIAAGLAIEQVGLPKLVRRENKELWNGGLAIDRLRDWQCRTIREGLAKAQSERNEAPFV